MGERVRDLTVKGYPDQAPPSTWLGKVQKLKAPYYRIDGIVDELRVRHGLIFIKSMLSKTLLDYYHTNQ